MRRGTRAALGALLGPWLLCASVMALPRQLSESVAAAAATAPAAAAATAPAAAAATAPAAAAATAPAAQPAVASSGAATLDIRGTLHSVVYGLGLLVKAGWPNEHPEQELQLIYTLVATAVGVLLALLCFGMCRLMWWSARAEFCPCCLSEEEVRTAATRSARAESVRAYSLARALARSP